jgi:hypothetical protein
MQLGSNRNVPAVTDVAHKPAARAGLPPPSIEHLWMLLPLALFGAFLALTPTQPHDFWWHLRVGQLVAEQGVPRTNLFAWTRPADAPFVYAAWLADWLFYQAYAAFGLQGPVLLRNLLGLVGFGLVAAEARRRSGSWRLAGLAVLLAGAASINNLTTRPQNVAWVLFAAALLLLGAYAASQVSPRALLLLPPLVALWVNAHGSFVLCLALLALYALGETLRYLLRQEGALSVRRLGWLYLACAASLLVTLANPIGPQIFGYVLKLLTDPPSQSLVNEWQPPTTRTLAGALFFGTVLVLVGALAAGRRRPTLTDALLLCAFLWLAFSGMRYVVWFVMLAMPVVAQCLAGQPRVARRASANAPFSARRPLSPAEPWFAGLVALFLGAGVLAVQPPFKASLGLPAAYRAAFADLPGAPQLYSADTPVGAAEYLRRTPGGRLFNDMAYGSYLIWAVPDQPVFVDPRVELFPLALWQDYQAIGEARGYNGLLARYGADRVLLSRRAQPLLAGALADDAGWRLEYQDAQSQIYRRAP